MVNIQPITIWVNGGNQLGNLLFCQSVNDNLKDTAIFQWIIYNVINNELNQLSQGRLTMTGQDYINWNNDTDINSAAYNWIADQLSLTIIP